MMYLLLKMFCHQSRNKKLCCCRGTTLYACQ